jgi:ClpA/ClpB-like protein
VFERFTQGARDVVVQAQVEARELGHDFIGPEHLLLGLAHAGVVPGVTAEEVRERIPRGEHTETTGMIPFTPEAKRTLERALKEALRLAHNYIDAEHLLLGLLHVREGVVAEVLSDPGGVRDAVAGRFAPPAPSPGELTGIWDVVEAAKEELLGAQRFEEAARLRDEQRLLQQILSGRVPLPARWEYDVKTLDGGSDTWAAQLHEWAQDGWELISVVSEGGAVRAIVERRRRASG